MQLVPFWFPPCVPRLLTSSCQCRENAGPHLPPSPCALAWKRSSDSKVGHSYGSPHLFPDSHCLVSSVLRTTVSYILWGILVILGGDVNPVLVTPSWLEAEILMMVCSFVHWALTGGELDGPPLAVVCGSPDTPDFPTSGPWFRPFPLFGLLCLLSSEPFSDYPV